MWGNLSTKYLIDLWIYLSLWLYRHIVTFPVCNGGRIIRSKPVEDVAAAHILPRLWPFIHSETSDQTIWRAKLSSPASDSEQITLEIRLWNRGQLQFATSVFLPFVCSLLRLTCALHVRLSPVSRGLMLHFTPDWREQHSGFLTLSTTSEVSRDQTVADCSCRRCQTCIH